MNWSNATPLAFILPLLVLASCGERESIANPVNTTILQPSDAGNGNVIQPKAEVEQATASGNALISSCYHLESCGYWKILNVASERQEGEVRLLKASLEYGEVKNATGSADDEKRVQWSKSPDTIYALCSTSSPVIAWKTDEGKYQAEEFDFGGNGISGVQADNAMVYQALCHDFFNNQLSEEASALGYKPLPDGGRGQFEINTPDQLFGG